MEDFVKDLRKVKGLRNTKGILFYPGSSKDLTPLLIFDKINTFVYVEVFYDFLKDIKQVLKENGCSLVDNPKIEKNGRTEINFRFNNAEKKLVIYNKDVRKFFPPELKNNYEVYYEMALRDDILASYEHDTQSFFYLRKNGFYVSDGVMMLKNLGINIDKLGFKRIKIFREHGKKGALYIYKKVDNLELNDLQNLYKILIILIKFVRSIPPSLCFEYGEKITFSEWIKKIKEETDSDLIKILNEDLNDCKKLINKLKRNKDYYSDIIKLMTKWVNNADLLDQGEYDKEIYKTVKELFGEAKKRY